MPSALERLRALIAQLDAEAEQARRQHAGYDRGPLIGCVVAALGLVFMEYARERPLMEVLYAWLPDLYLGRYGGLAELALWVFVRLVGFFVLPALAVRLVLRESLRAHGLGVRGLAAHLPSYGLMFLLVLPFVVLASRQPVFTSYYPFYRLAGESWLDLGVWELLYALQFVGLEFFFRGFLLRTCFRSLGTHAVYVAALPYTMIHFTKPLLEVLAALPAGIALGFLALRARSIWGGALLHVAVALTMDTLALLQTSGLPTRALP